MPANTPCRHCGRIGFVRFEHVITKGQASRHYYCGACDGMWQVDETNPTPPDPPDSKRKRPIKPSD